MTPSIPVNEQKAVTPWFLYLVKTSNNSLYCGITTDVDRRFNEHCAQNYKSAKALRGKSPLSLVFQTQLENKSTALKAEIWVKKLRPKQKWALVNRQLLMPTAF
ncbi:GIY-YIG nuclease family protein [Glaciecola sp. 1036]|uniref:GIY-YIG nuclease family protein n=1 Tax=Alteromonadaceae TaxID=72275 RepID=UPI003CFC56B3